MLEHETKLFLEQVRPEQPAVVAGDPGQLGLLSVGQVFGVLPERVATILQLLGLARYTESAQQVPGVTAHDIERLGGPADDVKRIEIQLGVGTVRRGAVTELLGSVRRDKLDALGSFRAEEIEEHLQGPPGRGPWRFARDGRCRDRPRPSDTCDRSIRTRVVGDCVEFALAFRRGLERREVTGGAADKGCRPSFEPPLRRWAARVVRTLVSPSRSDPRRPAATKPATTRSEPARRAATSRCCGWSPGCHPRR